MDSDFLDNMVLVKSFFSYDSLILIGYLESDPISLPEWEASQWVNSPGPPHF